MIARVQSFRVVGLGLVFGLLLVNSPTWSDVLKGTVKDPGAPSASNGIAGVSLHVRDVKNTELAQGLTNEQGEYSVSYTGQKDRVQAIFEKLGFQPRPAKRWVVKANSPQRPVLLIREGAEDEYYKTAAATLSTEAANVSPEYLQDSATSVVALPANDKVRVLQNLKGSPAENFLAAIRTAEENKVVTTRVKMAIVNVPLLKSREINVETFKGTVQLSGMVSSPEEVNQAVEVARAVAGVTSVKNDMKVKYDMRVK